MGVVAAYELVVVLLVEDLGESGFFFVINLSELRARGSLANLGSSRRRLSGLGRHVVGARHATVHQLAEIW